MIRAIATPAVHAFGVAVTIVNQYTEESSPTEILHLLPSGGDGKTIDTMQWEQHRVGQSHEPTLVLPDEFARPLLEALTRYYSGTEDTRALRRDYDAERKRVDDLIGHLATVTRTLAEPQ